MTKFKISYKKLYFLEKEKNKEKEEEIKKLKKIIEEKEKEKGYLCLKNGKKYEETNYNIVKHCKLNDKPFNTQKSVEELGGATSQNDLQCNFQEEKDFGIEIKKYNTPDWMQCSIKYNDETKNWESSNKSKIPLESKKVFDELLKNIKLFDGKIPPFMEKKITHKEWITIKNQTTQWDDTYITVPSDTISKLYDAKNTNYIQISKGYGLFHTGNDICNFGVPLFENEQQIRIRTKIHARNKKGYCSISVMASCQPKNIKNIIPSNYSLDCIEKLPPSLVYDNNL